MAPPLGTPELQKELADIARRIVENGKVWLKFKAKN